MRTEKYLIYVIIIFFISLKSFAGETSIMLNTIVFNENVTMESYLKLKKTIDENPNAEEIVLASAGGDLVAGMAMRKLIKSKGLNVRVVGICASSCANYLFIAGNKKIIQRNAALFFHGGFQQAGALEAAIAPKAGIENNNLGATFFYDKNKKYPAYILNIFDMKEFDTPVESLAQLIEIEKKYFAEMMVNNELPTYGQKGIYKDLWNSGKYHGFYYDIDSLKRLGIKNIEIEGGHWHPEESNFFDKLYKVEYP